MIYTLQQNQFTLSTEFARLQPERIHSFLARAYWANTRPPEKTNIALQHSLNFGIYDESKDGLQIGFARVVTDYAIFAYLCDVFIEDDYRGAGLGKWLIASIKMHPELMGMRRWMLTTQDAHGLYVQNGFELLPQPELWMQIFNDWT